MTPADRGRRRTAQPGRADARRPDRPRRLDPAREPGHRRRAARQPECRQRGCERAPHRGLRLPQPVPDHGPARAPARSGPATSAGTPGRRSTGPDADRGHAELRLAVLRGHGRAELVRQPEPQPVRVALRQGTGAHSGPVLHVQPPVARRGRRGVRRRLVLDLRPRLHAAGKQLPGRRTTARCSSRTTAATASGRCSPEPTGSPTPNNRQTFVSGASNPVELQFGPGGDLYYVDLDGGTIRRIRSLTTNRAPVARATATPSSGSVPLSVAFNGSTSSDPDGQATDVRLGSRRRRRLRRLDRRRARASSTPSRARTPPGFA